MGAVRPSEWVLLAAALVVAAVLAHAALTGSTTAWVVLTELGSEEFYFVAGLAAYYFLDYWPRGFAVLSSVVVSGSLNIFLKYSLRLPRPPDPLVEVRGPGFPSGHAQVSSSFWSSLCITTRSRVLAALSVLVVLGVSTSRVVLRAHYLHDVVGGVLLGVLVALVSALPVRLSAKSASILALSLHAVSAALSATSALVLEAELDSASALLGLSSALAATVLFREKLRAASRVATGSRLLGVAVSTALMLGVHASTRGLYAARAFGFFAAGLAAFSATPLALLRLEAGALRSRVGLWRARRRSFQ